jgi:formylglycine-generating enzyme required for sulfatase activity
LGALLAFWGPVNPVLPQADIDGNGIVDGADLGVLLANWGPCGILSWATVIEWKPDPAVVTEPALRAAIQATGMPWRVRDTATAIEMMLVPPGTFQMGCMPFDWELCAENELPVHQVTLTNAFYIGRYEVTQAEWVTTMGSNPSYFQDSNGYPGSSDRPVEQATWNAIQGYLNATDLRLPTEAEWEYACRAGTQSPFYDNSTDVSTFNTLAWTSANSNYQSHSVGEKAANGLGLHDMLGNVAELVSDWYGPYEIVPATNPMGPTSGTVKAGRGGSFRANPWLSRCAARFWGNLPDSSDYERGFRVARNP